MSAFAALTAREALVANEAVPVMAPMVTGPSTVREPVIRTEPVKFWVFVRLLPNTFEPELKTTEEVTLTTERLVT